MLDSIVEFFRKLKFIVQNYDTLSASVSAAHSRLNVVDSKIGEHITVHADVHFRNSDLIIAVGRYRNHDYVRCFVVSSRMFYELIDVLRHEEPKAHVGRFDMPYNLDISAVYDRKRL